MADKSSNSPFQYGQILSPEHLIDREQELALLHLRLVQGERHFLIGPRRFGKTSLLQAAAASATAAGVPTILVNAESYTTLNALAGGIVAKASTLVKASLRDRILKILEWFSMLQPQAEYDATSDSIKVSVAARESVPASQSIADALDSLDKVAKEKGIRIGIIIDEFQSISLHEGIPAERILRAVVQHHEHLSYIFSGSDTRMMSAMITEHRRPFYRLGDSQHLGLIPREDFAHYITKAFATRDQTISEEALRSIFDHAEDVPYNIQKLCAYAWDLGTIGSPTDISYTEVTRAMERLLKASHGAYLALFLTLTNIQRKVIFGMAKRRSAAESDTVAARRANVAPSSYRAARKAFLQNDILRDDFSDGKTRRWAFVDPFFAAWIRGFVEG